MQTGQNQSSSMFRFPAIIIFSCTPILEKRQAFLLGIDLVGDCPDADEELKGFVLHLFYKAFLRFAVYYFISKKMRS